VTNRRLPETVLTFPILTLYNKYMASSENIIDRIKKTSPDMAEVVSDFISATGSKGLIMLTDDMTPEEEEMAVFKSLIEDGYSTEDAERLAPVSLKELKPFLRRFMSLKL